MKISVIAKDTQQLFNWLKSVCRVRGRKMAHRVEQVKIWHDDVLPMKAGVGSIRNAYEVVLEDACQSHVNTFDNTPLLHDGYQYVISRNAIDFLEGVPVFV